MTPIDRRQALKGAAAATAGVPVLAACGSDGEDASSTGRPKAGTEIGPTSEVPEGGGKIYGDDKVVVTQPSSGEFKGFDSTCTHQGCQVSKVEDGFIVCTCHNSRFAIATGEPTFDSPAKQPLGSVELTVADDTISLA